jgi:hypothetical protein
MNRARTDDDKAEIHRFPGRLPRFERGIPDCCQQDPAAALARNHATGDKKSRDLVSRPLLGPRLAQEMRQQQKASWQAAL